MSSTTDSSQVGPQEEQIKPEGKEESEELASETEEVLDEAENERIERIETDHEKAKRRKRGNNTQ